MRAAASRPRSLESLGISLDAVRQQVEEIIGRGQQASDQGHIPFAPRAKDVLELSLRESLQLGHGCIGTEHILLGLLREGGGVAAQVLVRLGADLNRVREQVIQLLHGYQGQDVLLHGYRGQDAGSAGSDLGGGGLVVLADDALAWFDALDRRLTALERWVNISLTWKTWTQEIAQVRREKAAAMSRFRDSALCATRRSSCSPPGLTGRRSGRDPLLANGGRGTGPAEYRTGKAAGDLARARHRAGRRCIGAHAIDVRCGALGKKTAEARVSRPGGRFEQARRFKSAHKPHAEKLPFSVRERASGFGSGGRDLNIDLWVMSHTTHVSPVSRVPERLADQAKAWLNVVGVSLRLPRPARSRYRNPLADARPGLRFLDLLHAHQHPPGLSGQPVTVGHATGPAPTDRARFYRPPQVSSVYGLWPAVTLAGSVDGDVASHVCPSAVRIGLRSWDCQLAEWCRPPATCRFGRLREP